MAGDDQSVYCGERAPTLPIISLAICKPVAVIYHSQSITNRCGTAHLADIASITKAETGNATKQAHWSKKAQ